MSGHWTKMICWSQTCPCRQCQTQKRKSSFLVQFSFPVQKKLEGLWETVKRGMLKSQWRKKTEPKRQRARIQIAELWIRLHSLTIISFLHAMWSFILWVRLWRLTSGSGKSLTFLKFCWQKNDKYVPQKVKIRSKWSQNTSNCMYLYLGSNDSTMTPERDSSRIYSRGLVFAVAGCGPGGFSWSETAEQAVSATHKNFR